MLKVRLQALSSAQVSHACILLCASSSIRTQQPDCFPKRYTERKRHRENLFLKGKLQLVFSLSKSKKKKILIIGVNFEGFWFHKNFYFFGIYFLLCVTKHANKCLLHIRQKSRHLHLHVSFISGSAQGTPRSLLNLMLVY